MLISLAFQYVGETQPAVVTGVDGDITDLILPSVGDCVRHHDDEGRRVTGRVIERTYDYNMPAGIHIDGTVTVTIMLTKKHN